MVINIRALVILVTIAAAGIMLAQAAFAQGNSGDTKPGWGYGDKNHIHTGPPGQSIHP